MIRSGHPAHSRLRLRGTRPVLRVRQKYRQGLRQTVRMQIEDILAVASSVAAASTLGIAFSGLAAMRARRSRRTDLSWAIVQTSVSPPLTQSSQPDTGNAGSSPSPTPSIDDLEKRISAVEALFPPSSEIDKYATVNDALLDSGLSHLRARVIAIEAQMLTRWEIAIVVFSILAALSVLTGAVFGIAAYVKPNDLPTPGPTPTP
jgi:hypothetical protein